MQLAGGFKVMVCLSELFSELTPILTGLALGGVFGCLLGKLIGFSSWFRIIWFLLAVFYLYLGIFLINWSC